MLDFYRVLVKEDGSIIHDIFATSHDDLVDKYSKAHGLICCKNYIKLMYSPKIGYKLDDLDNYEIIISDISIPKWFDNIKDKIESNLNDLISSMIISRDRKLILHEGVILNKNAKIGIVKQSVIFAMYDNSHIEVLDENTQVRRMGDNSIISRTQDSTKVILMENFSKVEKMFDSSAIKEVKDRATIGVMYDHTFIGKLCGTSEIDEMQEESQAEIIAHMSRVKEMHGFSQIEEMRHYSIVEKMFGNSKINYMRDNAIVEAMYGNSIVEYMDNDSTIEANFENSLVRRLNDTVENIQKKFKI